MSCHSLDLDLISFKAYAKFDHNPSISSQDIEHNKTYEVSQDMLIIGEN